MSWLKWLIAGFGCFIFPSLGMAHDGAAHLHPHGSESVILLGIVLVTVIILLIWQWQKH